VNHWQDIIIAIGSLVFSIALLPSVFSKHKPALWTSVITGIVLFILALTYASLRFWYATTITALTASLWLVLAAQNIFQSKD
jgi:uncharacterized membrane protein YjdF